MKNVKKSIVKVILTTVSVIAMSAMLLISCKQSGVSEIREVVLNAGNVTNKGTTKVYYSAGRWYEDRACTRELDKITIPEWNYKIVRVFENAENGNITTKVSELSSNGKDRDSADAAPTAKTKAFTKYGDIITADGSFTGRSPSKSSYDAEWGDAGKERVNVSVPNVDDIRLFIGDEREFKSYAILKLREGKDGSKKEDYEVISDRITPESDGSTVGLDLEEETTYLKVNAGMSGYIQVMFKDPNATSGQIVYYDNDDGSWRDKADSSSDKNKVASVARKERVQTIKFQGDSPKWTNKEYEYRWIFKGYNTKPDGSGRPYADEHGALLSISLSDIKEDAKDKDVLEVYAYFEKPDPLDLKEVDLNGEPKYIPEKDGKTFDYWWSIIDGEKVEADDKYETPEWNNNPGAKNETEITLFAEYRDGKTNRMTLDSNGATADYGWTALDNVKEGNLWYKGNDTTRAITSIRKPEKVWTINYDVSWQGASIGKSSEKYNFKFLGYKLDGNSDKTVIDADGNIVSEPLVGESHAKAEWGSDGIKIENTIEYTEKDKGVEFVGWSRESGIVITDDDELKGKSLIGDIFVPEKDNETLYGVWKDTRKYKLELLKEDSTDTTGDNGVNEIWYSVGKGAWYLDSGLNRRVREAGESVGESIAVPERVWSVSYVAGIDDVVLTLSEANTKFRWIFNGYGKEENRYITENGEMVKGVKIAKNERVKADWGEPSGVALPTEGNISKPNTITLNGWKKSKSGTELVQGPYKPESDGVVLYGAWNDGRTAVIHLGSQNAGADASVDWNGATKAISYNESQDKWYIGVYEPNATTNTEYSAEKFKAPTKQIDIVYTDITTGLMHGGTPVQIKGSTAGRETITYPFAGYPGYIEKNKELRSGVKASNKVDNGKWVDVSWGSPSKTLIELPEWECDGYVFSGWREKGTESAGSKFYNLSPKETRGTITLEAVWESTKKYAVKLDGNKATSGGGKTIYVRERDKAILINEGDGDGVNVIATQYLPKKEHTLKLDKNGNTEATSLADKKVEWEFLGYNTKEDGSGEQYIDKNGRIDEEKLGQITNDMTLHAIWSERSKVVVVESLVGKVKGYTIKGWSFDKDASTGITDDGWIFTDDTDDTDDNIVDKAITLYLIWDYNKVYTLTLWSYYDEEAHNSAIYSFDKREIYYREGDGWYSIKERSADGRGEIVKAPISKVSVPKKSRRITLDLGRAITEESLTTTIYPTYSLLGYGANGADTYNIDKDGNIADLPSISANQPMYASWGEIETVSLPSITAKDSNWLFEGWKDGEDEISTEDAKNYKTPRKEVILSAMWRNTTNIRVVLNHNGGESINNKNFVIKNPTNGLWYDSEDLQSQVSGDLVAERKVTVRFDNSGFTGGKVTDLPDAEMRWEFLGYKISGKEFIDKNGDIIGDASKNEEAVAIWGDLEEGLDLSKLKLYCEGWTFLGWSADNGVSVLPTLYKPEWDAKYSGGSGVITLKSVWSNEKVYPITLDNNSGATNSTIIYKARTNGYHANEKDASTIDYVRKPSKSWIVTFDTNLDKSEVINDKTIVFTFNGYKGTDGKTYIDKNGKFTSERPSTTAASGTAITWKADWSSDNTIVLPTTERSGWTFLGWTLEKNGTVIGQGGSTYTINDSDVKSGNRVVLYGKWQENAIYQIDIVDETSTSKGLSVIYYRQGDGWYEKRNVSVVGKDSVENAISRVLKPQRIWYVSFESMLSGVENPSPVASESIFGGLCLEKEDGTGADASKQIALGDGSLITTGNTLPTKSGKAYVVWSDSSVVSMPSRAKEGYEFIGWIAKKDGIEDTNNISEVDRGNILMAGVGFVPEYEKYKDIYNVGTGTGSIRFYGVWRNMNIYKLTLDGNGETSETHTKAIYYKPQTKEWYLDEHGEGESTLSVRAPEKEWKVRYNTTWMENPIYNVKSTDQVKGIDAPLDGKLVWTFGGYETLITSKDEADSTQGDLRYYVPGAVAGVDKDKQVYTGITGDRTIKALWTKVSLNGNDDRLPNDDFLSNTRWVFDGWSEEPDANSVVLVANPYRPFDGTNRKVKDAAASGGERDFIQVDADGTKYVTLYAHWRDRGTVNVELDGDGATTKTNERLYYDTGEYKWYTDAGKNNAVDRITSPKKEWTIVFDGNAEHDSTVSTEAPLDVEFKFNGYVLDPYATGTTEDDSTIIKSSGKIEVVDEVNNYLRTDGNENLRAKAKWSAETNTIVMPSYITRQGYKLTGWSTVRNPNVESGQTYAIGTSKSFSSSDADKLEADGKTIRLYAQWEQNSRYTLTLNAENATNKDAYTKSLTYWVGKGWFRTANPSSSDTPLVVGESAVTIPEYKVDIKFDINTQDSSVTKPVGFKDTSSVNRRFLGYDCAPSAGATPVGFITAEGNLLSTAILSESMTASASWGNASAIKLTTGFTREDYEFEGWAFEEDGQYTHKDGTKGKLIFTDYVTLGDRDEDWTANKYIKHDDTTGTNTLTLYAVWRSTRVFRVKLHTTGWEVDVKEEGGVKKIEHVKQENAGASGNAQGAYTTSGSSTTIYYREADEKWYTDLVSSDSHFTRVGVPSSIYTFVYRTNNSEVKAPDSITEEAEFVGFNSYGRGTIDRNVATLNEQGTLWIDENGIFNSEKATTYIKGEIAKGLKPTELITIYPLYKEREKVTVKLPPGVEGTKETITDTMGTFDEGQVANTHYYFYAWVDDLSLTYNEVIKYTSQEPAVQKRIHRVDGTTEIKLTAMTTTVYACLENTSTVKVKVDLNKGAIINYKSALRGESTASLNAKLNSNGTYDGGYVDTLTYKVSDRLWYAVDLGEDRPTRKLEGDAYTNAYMRWNLTDHSSVLASGTDFSQKPVRVDAIKLETDFDNALTNSGKTVADTKWKLTKITKWEENTGSDTAGQDGTKKSPTYETTEWTPTNLAFAKTMMIRDYTWEFDGYYVGDTDTKVFDKDMNFVIDREYVPTDGLSIKARWKSAGRQSIALPTAPDLHIKESNGSTADAPKGEIVETSPTSTVPSTRLTDLLLADKRDALTSKDNYIGPTNVSIDNWANTGWTTASGTGVVGTVDDNRMTVASVTYTPDSSTITEQYWYEVHEDDPTDVDGQTPKEVATRGYRYTATLYAKWSFLKEYAFHLIVNNTPEGGIDGNVKPEEVDGFGLVKSDGETIPKVTETSKGLPVVTYSTLDGWKWTNTVNGEIDDIELTKTVTITQPDGTLKEEISNADVVMPNANKQFIVSFDVNGVDGVGQPEAQRAGAKFAGYYLFKSDFVGHGFTDATLPWKTGDPNVDGNGDLLLMSPDITVYDSTTGSYIEHSLGLANPSFKITTDFDKFNALTQYKYRHTVDNGAGGTEVKDESIDVIPAKSKWIESGEQVTLPDLGTHNGYTHIGWSRSKTGTADDDKEIYVGDVGETYTPEKSETLYAVWYEIVKVQIKHGSKLASTDDGGINYIRIINIGEDDEKITKQTGETFISDGQGVVLEFELCNTSTNALATRATFHSGIYDENDKEKELAKGLDVTSWFNNIFGAYMLNKKVVIESVNKIDVKETDATGKETIKYSYIPSVKVRLTGAITGESNLTTYVTFRDTNVSGYVNNLKYVASSSTKVDTIRSIYKGKIEISTVYYNNKSIATGNTNGALSFPNYVKYPTDGAFNAMCGLNTVGFNIKNARFNNNTDRMMELFDDNPNTFADVTNGLEAGNIKAQSWFRDSRNSIGIAVQGYGTRSDQTSAYYRGTKNIDISKVIDKVPVDEDGKVLVSAINATYKYNIGEKPTVEYAFVRRPNTSGFAPYINISDENGKPGVEISVTLKNASNSSDDKMNFKFKNKDDITQDTVNKWFYNYNKDKGEFTYELTEISKDKDGNDVAKITINGYFTKTVATAQDDEVLTIAIILKDIVSGSQDGLAGSVSTNFTFKLLPPITMKFDDTVTTAIVGGTSHNITTKFTGDQYMLIAEDYANPDNGVYTAVTITNGKFALGAIGKELSLPKTADGVYAGAVWTIRGFTNTTTRTTAIVQVTGMYLTIERENFTGYATWKGSDAIVINKEVIENAQSDITLDSFSIHISCGKLINHVITPTGVGSSASNPMRGSSSGMQDLVMTLDIGKYKSRGAWGYTKFDGWTGISSTISTDNNNGFIQNGAEKFAQIGNWDNKSTLEITIDSKVIMSSFCSEGTVTIPITPFMSIKAGAPISKVVYITLYYKNISPATITRITNDAYTPKDTSIGETSVKLESTGTISRPAYTLLKPFFVGYKLNGGKLADSVNEGDVVTSWFKTEWQQAGLTSDDGRSVLRRNGQISIDSISTDRTEIYFLVVPNSYSTLAVPYINSTDATKKPTSFADIETKKLVNGFKWFSPPRNVIGDNTTLDSKYTLDENSNTTFKPLPVRLKYLDSSSHEITDNNRFTGTRFVEYTAEQTLYLSLDNNEYLVAVEPGSPSQIPNANFTNFLSESFRKTSGLSDANGVSYTTPIVRNSHVTPLSISGFPIIHGKGTLTPEDGGVTRMWFKDYVGFDQNGELDVNEYLPGLFVLPTLYYNITDSTIKSPVPFVDILQNASVTTTGSTYFVNIESKNLTFKNDEGAITFKVTSSGTGTETEIGLTSVRYQYVDNNNAKLYFLGNFTVTGTYTLTATKGVANYISNTTLGADKYLVESFPQFTLNIKQTVILSTSDLTISVDSDSAPTYATVTKGPTSADASKYYVLPSTYTVNGVTVPITTIAENAFTGSAVSSIQIPDSYTTINSRAFTEAKNLTAIKFGDNIRTINDYVFDGCTALQYISIGKSVTRFGYDGGGVDGDFLRNIPNLRTIEVSKDNPNFKVVDGCLVAKSHPGVVYVGTLDAVIPETAVFSGTVINTIQGRAFCGRNITEITIPVNITTIGSGAFRSCSLLKTFNYKGTKSQWASITKPSEWKKYSPFTVVHCTDGDVSVGSDA